MKDLCDDRVRGDLRLPIRARVPDGRPRTLRCQMALRAAAMDAGPATATAASSAPRVAAQSISRRAGVAAGRTDRDHEEGNSR